MKRIPSTSCLLLSIILLLLLSVSPQGVFAYKVFIEHDGSNEAHGPLTVPVAIMVVWGTSEAPSPPNQIEFKLEWDCEGMGTSNGYCVGAHGNVLINTNSILPPIFSDLTILPTCLAIDCGCLAVVRLTADVLASPPPGTALPLAIFEFSRIGYDIQNCQPVEFSVTEFRISCLDDPSCDGGGTFLMTEGDIPARESTWSRIKALYK
jgi:hypothetical protein